MIYLYLPRTQALSTTLLAGGKSLGTRLISIYDIRWCIYRYVRKGVASIGVERSISGGGGDIHIFVFTDLKNNRFQKKLIMQNTNIWIWSPPLIDISTPMVASGTPSPFRLFCPKFYVPVLWRYPFVPTTPIRFLINVLFVRFSAIGTYSCKYIYNFINDIVW
jgi:hypothetical protein